MLAVAVAVFILQAIQAALVVQVVVETETLVELVLQQLQTLAVAVAALVTTQTLAVLVVQALLLFPMLALNVEQAVL
jgi:hypothetical protein